MLECKGLITSTRLKQRACGYSRFSIARLPCRTSGDDTSDEDFATGWTLALSKIDHVSDTIYKPQRSSREACRSD